MKTFAQEMQIAYFTLKATVFLKLNPDSHVFCKTKRVKRNTLKFSISLSSLSELFERL